MNVDDIGLHPFSDPSLIFEFEDRFLNDISTGRVQDYKLIRVEAGSQFVLRDELPALFEASNNFIAIWQICDRISAFRMSLDGKDLAVDSKAADVVCCTELEGGQQGVSILHAQTAQLCQSIRPFHLADGRGSRGDEFDGLVPEHAAEAKTNHGLPQFIAVIDSCNTVPSETQTKYGIWARLTHL